MLNLRDDLLLLLNILMVVSEALQYSVVNTDMAYGVWPRMLLFL